MEEHVILVNEQDQETGTMEKLKAHQLGALHRAISVFLFNDKGEVLLQQRAAEKYHSPLKWTNTCCTHPRPGEDLNVAAVRRLVEEMGIRAELTWQYSFIYKAELDGGLTEHELDHVFFGKSKAIPVPNSEEVAAWKYLSLEAVESEMTAQPDSYTEWFKIMLNRIKKIRDEHID